MHNVRYMNRSFFFNNAALRIQLVRFLVLFNHIDAFHKHTVLTRISSDNATFFTFVFTADYDNRIVFFDVQLIVMGFKNFFQSWHFRTPPVSSA
ncbi:hypothetical protein D1872_296350 [compost metagenome]